MATKPTKPRNHAEHLRKYQFKRGHDARRNPGGKPKVYVRFNAMLMERMMQPCPADIKKALRLGRGANYYDAIIQAMILSAASPDGTAERMNVHDLIEGRLANKSINLSAGVERLVSDPEFRQFVDTQLNSYLQQKGEPLELGTGFTEAGHEAPDGEGQ